MIKTILGTPPTAEQIQAQQASEFAGDVLRMILRETCDAYARGEITFERATRTICTAGKKADIGELGCYRLVGEALMRCNDAAPPITKRGRKGEPRWHRRVAVAGITWGKKRGGVVDREPLSGKVSVYAMVADYLTSVGLPTTPAQVEKWNGEKDYNESINSA